MNYKELKDKAKEAKAKNDAEVVLHTDAGDFALDDLEFSKKENKIRLCTSDETRRYAFRISYMITRDHKLFAFNTIRRMLASEDDVILDIDGWESRLLEESGISGEVSEKTGSTIVAEREQKVEIDPDTEKAKLVEKEVDHYYNCVLVEVFKELDEDADVYVRVWKNGKVG